MRHAPHVSIALALFLAGAAVGAACGRLPDTAAEAVYRPVRTARSPKASARPATPTPAPGGSPAGSPAPGGYTGRRVVLSGVVYDAAGATVDGARIRARSLDAATPFAAEAATEAGSYVLNDVPEGVLIELVASRAGWTTRRRVAAFQAATTLRHEAAFGAPRDGGGEGRGEGAAYFLAPGPEVVAVEPDDDDTDPLAGAFRLTLSEPLGAEDRRRFEAAVRVLPADDAANGGAAGTTTDLGALADDYPLALAVDGQAAVAPYAIRKGSTFRDDPGSRAAFTWNADGTEVMLRFPAPLLTTADAGAAYQIALVSGGPAMRIRDMDGNQLGTDAAGSFAAYPPRGDLVLSAFFEAPARLRGVTGLAGAAAAWAGTHRHAARFGVRADDEAPALVAAATGVQGDDTRLELTFSEPLAAYDGSPGGFVSDRLGDDGDDLLAYTFAVARTAAKADEVTLDGEDPLLVDPRVTPALDAAALQGRELAFAPTAFTAARDGAAPGSVLVRLDPFDPRRLVLTVLGRPDFFPPALSHLKARARAGDPAGNLTRAAAADRQTVLAAF